ncbi:hypothetical protein C900_02473 [Fulvivirga imtechensis AK7]|uniref:Uncharacterized protein n=1 Tax=Fulvivirga imtechensis AK7 TaxID=1237149 RepID=L8JTJ0_9BACT|nr:tetratricopeptide repeat protein [Fulvivirga imtechensis]ELR71558.1 hypothetical protein C900_02473 [Fulvivirga imtechensis AK7]
MKNILIIILSTVYISLFAQDIKETADKHFNDRDWEKAATAFEQYLRTNATDSTAWYNLAFSNMKLKKYDDAIAFYNKAEEYNFPISNVSINRAKSYLLKGDRAQAIAELKSGAEKGASAYIRLRSDMEFDPIRNDKGFAEALEKYRINAYPCLSSTDHRHLDFWVGEWEVFARGGKVGDNSITIANGGCAIHESYSTSHNYSGQSINYYDPIDKKWHQHWVGSAGDVYNYLETAKDNGMLRLESKFQNRNGEVSLSRMTFTLQGDGTVRQLMESSTDDGKTWTIAFDGLYKRKNE